VCSRPRCNKQTHNIVERTKTGYHHAQECGRQEGNPLGLRPRNRNAALPSYSLRTPTEVPESWRDDEWPTSRSGPSPTSKNPNGISELKKLKNKRRWPLNRPNSKQRRQDSVIYSRPVRSLRYFSQDDGSCGRQMQKHAPPVSNKSEQLIYSGHQSIRRLTR
jgi:hypothetical protein